MSVHKFLRVGMATAVVVAPSAIPRTAEAGTFTFWSGVVNNVASNHGGARAYIGDLELYHGYQYNAVDSETAAITCDTNWAFITGYSYDAANDHVERSLGYVGGGYSGCWKVRVRTPSNFSNYSFGGSQSSY